MSTKTTPRAPEQIVLIDNINRHSIQLSAMLAVIMELTLTEVALSSTTLCNYFWACSELSDSIQEDFTALTSKGGAV